MIRSAGSLTWTQTVYDWPKDGKLLVPAANRVKCAWLLGDSARGALTVTRSNKGLWAELPSRAPDAIDSVLAVEIEGPPQAIPTPANHALGKPVKVSTTWPGREKELAPAHITDGQSDTTWAAEEPAREAWVVVDLQTEVEVSRAVLSDAPYGRVREFDLEARVNGQWQKLAAGTTLGTRKELVFGPVTAREFRLNIRKAAGTPTLAEFELYGKNAQ